MELRKMSSSDLEKNIEILREDAKKATLLQVEISNRLEIQMYQLEQLRRKEERR